MKKMMILACLIFSVTAITAVAADVAKIQSTPNGDMVTELAGMDADGWCDYLNSVIDNGDDALIKRVVVNAQSALNTMDADAAKTVAEAVNANVSEVTVARYLTGKYALAYKGAANSDGKVVTYKNITGIGDNVGQEDLSGADGGFFKTSNLGKGGITFSGEEKEKPEPGPHPIPPVSGSSYKY